MLGVNNEAAESGSPMKRLLWRYENPKDACDPKNEPPPFLAALINFAVLAFVIGKFGQKPVAAALLKRKESIMQEIDNATRLREEAEARLEEYEEKFENIEEKLEATKAEFAAQSEAEKQRILLEAEERRVRMRRDAEFRIEQELKEARLALLGEAVEGAVKAAEALLKSRVASADQDRIAEEYLGAVGKAAAGGAHGVSATGGRA
jgi:F-type H+-transporting ATPase subunit b